MKNIYLLLLTAFIMVFGVTAVADEVNVPKEIGGFKLGSSIDEYEFVSYTNFLKQAVVEDIGPFRKGVIEYGICERPGEIVKIRLKYHDTSESFYRTLLKKYKNRLGEPDRFTGDPFGIVKAWKWHFIDNSGEKVSVTLQYNKKNFEESQGSVVRMSMPGRIEQERKCFNQVCATRMEEIEHSSDPKQNELDFMIPR